MTSGSSPRMRGTPRSPTNGVRIPRFIPAYAGNTHRPCVSLLYRAVHPRVCGEHRPSRKSGSRASGSSPRMRGTRRPEQARGDCGRFIPAYAGNTAARSAEIPRCPVHPRVCGEHFSRMKASGWTCGSSPRMRGTPPPVPSPVGPVPVHPRVCGEHETSIHKAVNDAGSSPRMRGTQCRCAQRQCSTRFIPAYAGNTGPQVTRHCYSPVHPRVCGEHFRSPWPARQCFGSSPRMRGTRQCGFRAISIRRFIPAYAGNTGSFRRNMKA